MSGTGKSTVLAELARRGHAVVDTDDAGWTEDVPLPGSSASERLWREERIAALLDERRAGTLFVSGCVANQGAFYTRFDAIVLLSAPLDVLLERVSSRTTNPYGKRTDERDEIVRNVAAVEPLLRAGATAEIDGQRSVVEIADELEAIAASSRT
jgi:shikimate kinase